MWWQPKQPLADAERRQEIRRLEAVREKLLNEAPKHFYFRRLLLPIMMAMVAYCRPSALVGQNELIA